MPRNLGTLVADNEIGHFFIDRVLGQGSFGITYLAIDPGLRRKVAIKEFFPSDYARRDDSGTIVPNDERAEATFNWALDRFSEEALTLAKFSHRNIVRVIEFIPRLHQTAYIVMDYVEGVTVESWIETSLTKDGQLPGKEECLSVFRQLLDGCSAMHRIGILHRDIKPKNIMLRTDHGDIHFGMERELVPVLIDFGSSRDLALQQDGFSALVTDGFSPPEQYSRNSVQGEYSDIYALACTFYFILSGKEPPHASARLVEPLPPISPERSKLFGSSLIGAVLAGMELQVGKRPTSIMAWRKMLKLDEAVRETPLTRRSLIIGGAVATAGIIGTGVWLYRQSSPLSNFARPLAITWQYELGAIFPDSYPQVRVSQDGGAIIAANILGPDAVPRMRAVRLNPNGQQSADWQDTAPDGMATAILQAADNGAFVGGSQAGQAMLVRLGSDWREQWRKDIGKGTVTAVLPTRDGIILGIEGPDFSGAEIVAMDQTGKLAWRTGIDKGKAETIQRMIALEGGGYAVLGWGVESRDTPGGKLNESYTFVALLDAEGNSRNRPQTKGMGAATAWGITEADDVIYVVGKTSDGRKPDSATRMFIWAIDHSGATQWLRWDYPELPSGGRGIAAADGGLLYVGGWSGEQQRMRFSQIGPGGDLAWDMIAPAAGRISAVFDLAIGPEGDGFAIGGAQMKDDIFQLLVTKLN